MIPILLLLSFKKKYHISIPSRYFLYHNKPFDKSGIWFHACSLGEVKSLQPILEYLKTDINLSVITHTGYEAAGKYKVDRRFLPYEIFLPFWIYDQKALVVLEAELWYMLFLVAKRKSMKTILLNARISDRSYLRYMRFSWFYKRIFSHIDKVFAQSQKDKERLEALGACNVSVSGNIKALQNISITHHFQKPKDKKVITFASTHEGEEALLLQYIPKESNQTLIVVPRHPERFHKVAEILTQYALKHQLSFHLLSEKGDFDGDIILVDKMGELVNIYAISDIVLLGGSFVPNIGGHNPLEPAHFHTKIISGKYIFNQEALFPLVEHIQFCDAQDLVKVFPLAQETKINTKADMMPLLEELNSVV